MQVYVEDLLHELLRFDRANHNKVKVEKMTKVVANAIIAMERETARDMIRALLEMDDTEGHA